MDRTLEPCVPSYKFPKVSNDEYQVLCTMWNFSRKRITISIDWLINSSTTIGSFRLIRMRQTRRITANDEKVCACHHSSFSVPLHLKSNEEQVLHCNTFNMSMTSLFLIFNSFLTLIRKIQRKREKIWNIQSTIYNLESKNLQRERESRIYNLEQWRWTFLRSRSNFVHYFF